MEDAISSVAEATDCTLVEASSEAAATAVVTCWACSAVLVSVPAEASSSVEADDSEPTNSPISDSNSRVMPSTRWPRWILASASSAAASSEAFLAINASLKTCKAFAMSPISVFSPWCGTSAVRSPSPSCLHGRNDGLDAGGHVPDQQDRGTDSDDHCQHERCQHQLDGDVEAFRGPHARRFRALAVQDDILLQRFVGLDAGKRRLGMQRPRLVVLVFPGQHQDLLYAIEIFVPGGAEIVVEGALLGRGDHRFIGLAGLVQDIDPFGEKFFLGLLPRLIGGEQMRADDRPIGDGRGPHFAELLNARQPAVHDIDGGGVDDIHLPDVQCPHHGHCDQQKSDDSRDLGADGEPGKHDGKSPFFEIIGPV